jgi:hypothetical protein
MHSLALAAECRYVGRPRGIRSVLNAGNRSWGFPGVDQARISQAGLALPIQIEILEMPNRRRASSSSELQSGARSLTLIP